MARLITGFINFVVRQALILIRFAAPWALWLVIFALGVSIRLSLIAVVSMYKGIVPVAERIADDWRARAVGGGFPTLWEVHLFNAFYILALSTIFAGWMILFFIAVFTTMFCINLMR